MQCGGGRLEMEPPVPFLFKNYYTLLINKYAISDIKYVEMSPMWRFQKNHVVSHQSSAVCGIPKNRQLMTFVLVC